MNIFIGKACDAFREMLLSGGMQTKLSADDKLVGIIDAALREAQNERDEIWKSRLANAVKVAQAEAYERAAKVAEKCRQGPLLADEDGNVVGSYAGNWCAAAIRALKDTSQTPDRQNPDTTS